jgi:hypothetical protein
MQQLIFRNWKFALLWAVGTIASIGAFFADDGGHKKLEQAAAKVSESRSTPALAQPDPAPGGDATEVDDGFTSDKELNSEIEAAENPAS